MKKLKFILLLLAFVITLVGLYNVAMKKDNSVSYKDKTEQFVHDSPNEIINRLINREQGIYYFGFPTCPWCIELLPILNNVLKNNNDQAYVVNTKADEYKKEDNELLKKFYKEITTEETLYVPFIVVIDGSKNIKTHIGTLDGHNAENKNLTNTQIKKLSRILNEMVLFSKN